ncbi:hypothetical protein SLNWT_4475 [Streptomyces albus]|uniref:Uncharacterized protein n=1 Tax=Streptomyces albus (strain ATCC 21838 / DSM 41398 / FERM P-419 / JCM 4703 / NBRC 107858) TaxID=1081613 RepID=A0A0B5F1X8_STRA4|nr:hypothetical protein SLNWT_4475 [Streptomyces albus]AOU79157.1 hypothetical protein SLNHY_4466 [Streptomyces albus]
MANSLSAPSKPVTGARSGHRPSPLSPSPAALPRPPACHHAPATEPPTPFGRISGTRRDAPGRRPSREGVPREGEIT